MLSPDKSVETLTQLLEWGDSAQQEWHKRHQRHRRAARAQPWLEPWFRGVSSSRYHLVPTLYRKNVLWDWRDPQVGELDLRRDFARRSPPYLDSETGALTTATEFYFAMQHYGMVTRLLDWSESILVAAYFATQPAALGDSADSDAAVWMLDPLVLNEITAEVGYRPLHIDAPELDPYFPPTRPGPLQRPVPEPPAALLAASPTIRLTAQRGTFTIHGALQIGLDEFEDADKFLRWARIPSAAVQQVSSQLRAAGVSEVTVYPDLDALSREIRTRTRRRR